MLAAVEEIAFASLWQHENVCHSRLAGGVFLLYCLRALGHQSRQELDQLNDFLQDDGEEEASHL